MLKRAFDIVFSLIGLVLALPLMLILAIWIKLDSKGPVFYRGVRTGRFGKPFRIFKFRTMAHNSQASGAMCCPDDDPRITRAGRFLRRFKLDELPQLINVLVGDMSFVGPRPEVEAYTKIYTEEEREILSVRPGITDWASIKFRNQGELLAGKEDPDAYFREHILPEKNRLRLEYARKHNLWTDLKILCSTFLALFK